MSKRVLLGMSGGVDSTVSAILLQKEGWIVEGVYMKLHNNDEYHRKNFEKAKRVADYLNIDIHFLDISDSFQKDVYDYFVESYKDGYTPNPCVVCNREIKFGKMIEFADTLGIKKVATGHYVRCDGESIKMAIDNTKDQSYFLAEVKREVLPRLIFPLGERYKSDVKRIAETIPLLKDIAQQKESQEICFVEGDYTDILKKHMDIDREGEVVNEAGEVVGTHKGYMHYTIGKRRGFSVKGAHDPHYVLSLDSQKNRIVVGKRESLSQSAFYIKNINLFKDISSFDAEVKVRYRTSPVPAHIELDGERGYVELKEPVFGLAKGQFAVFYDGDTLLGGGEII